MKTFIRIFASVLTFIVVIALFQPFWISKQFEIQFRYMAKEPFKIRIASDRAGDLFCPEKLTVTEHVIPESEKPRSITLETSTVHSSYFGIYFSVEASNSAVYMNNMILFEKGKKLPAEIKTFVFPVDLKQKSLRFLPDSTAMFSSGSVTTLHFRLPKYLKSSYSIDLIWLFYSILTALVFSILVFSLCSRGEIKEKKEFVFSLFGILLLILPVIKINYFEKMSGENRFYAPFPAIIKNQKFNNNAPKEFEAWLNDRIFGRDQMIRYNDSIFGMTWLRQWNVSGAKNHPDNDLAFWGKDQWMFTTAYNGINSVQHRNRFTNDELRTCAAKLVKLEQTFRKKYQVPMYLVIAPDKESVYEEFYPEYLLHQRAHEESRMAQLLTYLRENTELKISCPLPELLKEKTKYPVYYKTGTHWNSRGGACAAKDLLKLMKKDFPKIDLKQNPVKKWNAEIKADIDIAQMLKYRDPLRELPADMVTNDVPVFSVTAQNEQIDIDYLLSLIREKYTYPQSAGKTGLRMLVIGDSFWGNLMPHLYPHVTDFYRFFYGHGKDFELSLFEDEITAYKPDVIVVETTERFLHRFLTIKFGE